MLTREAFERQAAWPQDRIHGWAPGNYSCTCGDCGVHYVGDKRSVQCYPCAAKFVPPPRPETIEEIRADRDALRAELDRTKGEMADLRELTRYVAYPESRFTTQVPFSGDEGRWASSLCKLYKIGNDALRATLERKADA